MPGKTYSVGGGSSGQELELPTVDPETGEHHTCLVKKLSPQDLLRLGLLDELDSLTALVKTDHFDRVENKGKWKDGEAAPEPSEEDMLEMLKSTPDRFRHMFVVVGRVVALAVVEPKVYPMPEEGQDPLPGRMYVDEVPLENQVAIMQFAIGDLKAMEPFREGPQKDVADVPNVRKSVSPAKRTPRNR